MAVKIIVKGRDDLSPTELRSCRSLSFRNGGKMCDWLNYERGKPAKVVLAKDGDKLIGWGIVRSNKESGYYVRASERRKGIGGQILKTAKSIEPAAEVFPHDQRSRSFFRKYGAS